MKLMTKIKLFLQISLSFLIFTATLVAPKNNAFAASCYVDKDRLNIGETFTVVATDLTGGNHIVRFTTIGNPTLNNVGSVSPSTVVPNSHIGTLAVPWDATYTNYLVQVDQGSGNWLDCTAGPANKANIQVTPTVDQCTASDFNGDGTVDVSDTRAIASHWTEGTNPVAYNSRYDINHDTHVNEADLRIVYGCYGGTNGSDPGSGPGSGTVPQYALPDSPAGNSFTAQGFIGQLLTAILPIILGIAGFLTVIFIVISGIQFMTSSGNPEAAAAARSRLIFAIVGFVLIILAFAITQIVDRIFLGTSGVF